MCRNPPPPPLENRALYDTMWKNMVEPDRPQISTWRLRVYLLIPTTRNTHSKYVHLLFFHYSNGCTNAPEYDVVRTLPILLQFRRSVFCDVRTQSLYVIPINLRI